MAIRTDVDVKRNLMVHSFSGHASLNSIVETIDATLANPLYKPGMNMMWFCEDDVEIEISAEEPQTISDYARKKFDNFGKDYKLALVAGEDLAYGLFRLYQGWNGDRSVDINVFRKMKDAQAWIDS